MKSPASEDKSLSETQLDWSVLMDSFDEEMVEMVIHIFIEDAPQTIESLILAIEAGASDDVELHAHSLKGMSAQIGAERLRQKACLLEAAGKEENTDVFNALLAEAKTECDKVVVLLSQDNRLEKARAYYYKHGGKTSNTL